MQVKYLGSNLGKCLNCQVDSIEDKAPWMRKCPECNGNWFVIEKVIVTDEPMPMIHYGQTRDFPDAIANALLETGEFEEV